MLEVRELRAPKDVRDTEDRAAERATLFLKSRLKKLSDTQAAGIEKKLERWHGAWKKQTDLQRKRLVRYADLLEGVVEDSNVPFEGASNVTLHYAAGMARTFKATFDKTAYQDEDLFYAIPSPDLQKFFVAHPEMLAALEEGFNYSFSRESNGLITLKEGTIPCVRDGTLAISGKWVRDVQHVFDQRTYRSIEDFQKDYPDAEAAGIHSDQYQEILDFFIAHGPASAPADDQKATQTQDGSAPAAPPMPQSGEDAPELVVGFEYDCVKKNEPEYTVGPWAKFVRFPLYARNIGECQLYGYEYTESRESVKAKGRNGEYFKRGVDKALNVKTGEQSGADAWDKAMGYVEGVTPPTDPKDKPIRYLDGCCLLDLDRDGILEKYQIKYAPEEKALLSLIPHRLRRGIDGTIPFRMVKRENRLDGVSLIGDCEDLFNQIDFNVRHRNNVRILTTSPVFLANNHYKDQIDLGRAENVIRPGVTYWVDDPTKAIQQLELHDLSTTQDNMDELVLYKTHVELVFGPTQGMSGQQTPQDKRAPGNKTVALLTQANGRIDGYLDTFMESGPALADLHAALLVQFHEGPTFSFAKGAANLSFPIQLLAHPGLRWGIKRRSVQLTPEFAMARLANLQALWLQLRGAIAMGDPIAIEIWNRQVRASGEPQADKFFASGENLQAIQKAMQAAMQSDPKNPDVKAKSEASKAFHKKLGQAAAEKVTGEFGHNRV